MSADNSICILRTPKRNGNGFEYRVKLLGSAHWGIADLAEEKEHTPAQRKQIVEDYYPLFKECHVFESSDSSDLDLPDEVDEYCDQLLEEIENSGFYVEYGDTWLNFDYPY